MTIQSEIIIPFADTELNNSDFQRANMLVRKKDYIAAAAAYSVAIEKRPNFYPAWINYINCLILLDRPFEVLALVERYLDLFGDKISRIQDIQLIAERYLKFDIESIISNKLRVDPWISHVLKNTASVNGKDRLKLLHELFDKDPSLYLTCHLLGDTYFSVGNFSDSILWYEAALARDPNFGWSWFNMAKALIAINAPFFTRLNALNQAATLMEDSIHIAGVLRPLAEHLACTRFIRRSTEIYLQLSEIEPEGDVILYAIENMLKICDYENARSLVKRVQDWPNVHNHLWAKEFVDWAVAAKCIE